MTSSAIEEIRKGVKIRFDGICRSDFFVLSEMFYDFTTRQVELRQARTVHIGLDNEIVILSVDSSGNRYMKIVSSSFDAKLIEVHVSADIRKELMYWMTTPST